MPVGEMNLATGPWTTGVKRGVQFSTATRCATLEISQCASLAKPRWVEGTVDDVTLPQWLDETCSLPGVKEIDSETIGSSLRLLIALADYREVDGHGSVQMSFRKDTFTNLEKRLCLPHSFQALVTSYSTQGFKYSIPSQETDSKGFFWKIGYHCRDFVQLAINYDETTNSSTGLVLIRSGFDIIQAIRNGIEVFGNPEPHPLLLPLIFLHNELQLVTDRWWHFHLDYLAQISGLYEWDGHPLPDPLELDFVSVIRQLTLTSFTVFSDIGVISNIILALDQASQWESSLDMLSNTTSGSTQYIKTQRTSAILTARIEHLKNACNVLLVEAKFCLSGTRNISQAVYQFMAAKDAKTKFRLAETSAIIAKASKEDSAVMRMIAIESKRDSSAMKTISILGMLFLPGTFIAAVFGMQVFNWDGDGAPVIKSGLKYYWAVTIPVTLLVLTVWALAMFVPWKELLGKRSGRLNSRYSSSDDEAKDT